MRTVIKISCDLIFIALLFCSCNESGGTISTDKGGCFIIGGCENTDFDLDRLFIRTSYSLNGGFTIYKSSIFERDEIKGGIIISTDETYSVCGSVKYEESPVLANLTFIRRPDQPLIPATMADTDEFGNFCAALNKGEYTILVSPYKHEAIPQLKLDITVDADISNFNIIYPSADNVRYIYGNVILDTTSNLPVEGINVLAYKKYEDGVTLQSNVSTTDSDGNFSLVIPNLYGAYSLMIYGSPKNPDWPIIRFPDIITEGIIQIGSINLGFVPHLTHISGISSTQEKIQIIATMDSDEFSYSKNFNTDEDGYFETDLREGRYNFLMVPSDIYSSKWSITAHSNISVPSQSSYKLSLEKKVNLMGRLIFDDKSSTPRIKIIRDGGCEGNSSDNINFEISIIPDSNGYFNLDVSKGRYRIQIITEDIKSANMISNSFCINDNINLNEFSQPLSCTLKGEIKNDTSTKLSNIRTELFLFDKKRVEYVKIAESSSESKQFTLKIPAYFCQ